MNEAMVRLLARVENARSQLAAAKLPDKAVTYCINGLERMERVLARAPRVAILGEFNSGKTSVADLLLGNDLLPTGVVANTHVPVLIRYSGSMTLFAVTQNGRQRLTDYGPDELPSGLELRSIEIGLPSDRLLSFQILDTPSVAEISDVVGDAEILIWCTVATRAWTESERAAWAALPRRCWRNGFLVATHRDSLQDATDLTKIEQRLRAVTAPMFRDVLLVSAAGKGEDDAQAEASSVVGTGAEALIAHVEALADEITERRAHKAEKIIRRLARLTFHHLAAEQLKKEATTQLKDWEARSNALLDDLEQGTASLSVVIEKLLREFAIAVEEARPGSVQRQSTSRELVATNGNGGGWPLRAAAGKRFARLLAADLTALLRIELAHWGLRDPAKDVDYRMARSVLMQLADLGGAFDALGQILLSGRGRPAAPSAGIGTNGYGGTGLLH